MVVSGPDLRSPASCLTAWAGPWSSDAADALASPPWRVPRGRSSPRRWGPSRRCAARPLPARERDLLGPLWCPWSAPGRPSGARGRAVVSFLFPSVLLGVSAAVVCPVSGSLGGVETVKGAGACLCFSPSVGGRGPAASSPSPSHGVPWGGPTSWPGRRRVCRRPPLACVCGESHTGVGAIALGRGLREGGVCRASRACSSLPEPGGRAWGAAEVVPPRLWPRTLQRAVCLPIPQTPPTPPTAGRGLGGSWSASVGPKGRDDGWGMTHPR